MRLSKKTKLWGGAFSAEPDERAWAFGRSLETDFTMWREELDVSIAHTKMLKKCGIVTEDDADAVIAALDEMRDGEWLQDPDICEAEDIHAAIESFLFRKVGEAAHAFTAGRSRNDQVSCATRLWTMRRCGELCAEIKSFQEGLLDIAEKHSGDLMPGYTHQQPAQPITLGYHFMAYFWMLQRDGARFQGAAEMANANPLGSGALAGTSLPLDRELTTRELGFQRKTENALDASSDRDFVGDALHACAMLTQHLSRISQELILWSTAEYGFVKIADEYSTGSSLMPQKRNPDIAELIRGRSARVIGHWCAFMAMMKALPLAYNRDMQEDKPPLFDSFAICFDSLSLAAGMIRTSRFDLEKMRAAAGAKWSVATNIAEWLVGKGIPFRRAHEATGKFVRECEARGWLPEAIDIGKLRSLLPEADESCLPLLSPEGSVASRETSENAVAAQIAKARELHRKRDF